MTTKTIDKQAVMQPFQANGSDTGSTGVQVALLTARIKHLTEHLKIHKGDNHTRLGLLKMVSKRKSLLNYMKRNDFEGYARLLKELNIRH